MSTIGTKIDELHDLREQKRVLESQIDDLKNTINELEYALIEQMDSEGVAKASGKKASVGVNSVTRPSVEDWDAFYKFIHRNQYYHLLERRPSVTGCNELFETKGAIPGVVPFTQRKISLRTTS
jgi:hypothetical protein